MYVVVVFVAEGSAIPLPIVGCGRTINSTVRYFDRLFAEIASTKLQVSCEKVTPH
jgi:hypothetical protein